MQTCNPEHRTYAHMRDVEIALIESPSNSLAKAGQDVRFYANVLLARACECVRVREGRTDFGALEELPGQIKPDAQGIHAESLRERVRCLENHYPEVHAAVPFMLSEQAAEAPEEHTAEEAQIHLLEQARQFILSAPDWHRTPSCFYPGQARWRPNR